MYRFVASSNRTFMELKLTDARDFLAILKF